MTTAVITFYSPDFGIDTPFLINVTFAFSDFGIDTLMEHVEKTNFPWLMSNVIDNETGRPLADGKVTHIMEWWGRKIGLVSWVILLYTYTFVFQTKLYSLVGNCSRKSFFLLNLLYL